MLFQDGWTGAMPKCKSSETKVLSDNPEENEIYYSEKQNFENKAFIIGCDMITVIAIVFVRFVPYLN